MKIGIDARFLTHPQRGGFKTYSESLIATLAEIDTDNEYILYLDRPPDPQTKLPNRPNFIPRIVPGTLPLVGMPWREQVGLLRQVTRDQPDLLHSPCLTAPLSLTRPSVVTIHDMIWYFPQKYSKSNRRSLRRNLITWYLQLVPLYSARHAAGVLTPSQSAKDDIVKYLGLAKDKVYVTQEAASQVYRHVDDARLIQAVRFKYNLTSEFVLAIGSADPRKNITTLVLAYALLPLKLRARYKLVIVWTHDLLKTQISSQIEKLGLNNQVQFLEHVSNEDLALLYNAASLFVLPSLYEGFGLPPLEAMACGTPVVASNNSSIPEIVGDAALLVEGHDAKTMADMMCCVLTDEATRADLIQKGLKRAMNFSWNKCASQTIAAYRKTLGIAEIAEDGLDKVPPDLMSPIENIRSNILSE